MAIDQGLSIDSEEAEAPESMSLFNSRETALLKMKTARIAAGKVTQDEKKRRRDNDALFKHQAALRRDKVAKAIAEITRRGEDSPDEEVSAKKTFRGSVLDYAFDGEVEVKPGERVVLFNDKKILKTKIKVADASSRSKEAMMMLRNASNRVEASVSQAPCRFGRPASKFVLSQEESRAVKQRLKALRPSRKTKTRE